MRWSDIEANWERIALLAAAQWPELTADDLALVSTRADLDHCISERVGISVQEARHQTQEFGLRLPDVEHAAVEAAPEPKPAPPPPPPTPPGSNDAERFDAPASS